MCPFNRGNRIQAWMFFFVSPEWWSPINRGVTKERFHCLISTWDVCRETTRSSIINEFDLGHKLIFSRGLYSLLVYNKRSCSFKKCVITDLLIFINLRITFRSPMMSWVLNCRHCPLLSFSPGSKGKKSKYNSSCHGRPVRHKAKTEATLRARKETFMLFAQLVWARPSAVRDPYIYSSIPVDITSFFRLLTFCVTSKRRMDGERGKMSAQLSWVKFTSWTLNWLSRVIDIDTIITRLLGCKRYP